MRVIDPGHVYELDEIGGGHQVLVFIKRSDPAQIHPEEFDGLIVQEVLRACIDRTEYLNEILRCDETELAAEHLKAALYEYESRAWRRKRQGKNKTGLAHDSDVECPPFTAGSVAGLPVGSDGHVIA